MSHKSKQNMNFSRQKNFHQKFKSRKTPQQFSYHQSQSSQNQQKSSNKFNYGHEKDQNTSESEQSSQNQTQHFIKAEFNKNQAIAKNDFKLFGYQDKNSAGQIQKSSKLMNAIQNQKKQKQKSTKSTKKPLYENTFFEIQIQDQFQQKTKQQIRKSKQQQKNSLNMKNIKTVTQALSQFPQGFQSNTQFSSLNHFHQIQNLQKIIKQTLKQKQNQIFLLQKEIQTCRSQKLYQFQVNQQLQKQLLLIRKQRAKQQKILQGKKEQNCNDNLKNNQGELWKPKNAQQMKLACEYEKLLDQLEQVQQKSLKLKRQKKQSENQQIVLKSGLKTAFKARRQYIKNVTNSHQSKQSYTCEQHGDNSIARRSCSRNTKVNPLTNQKKVIYTSTKDKKQNKNSIPCSDNIQFYYQVPEKQLQFMDQKKLLLKLLQDFNELKQKVDDSIIIKNQKANKKRSSAGKIDKRRVASIKN